jgi:hypothetical protein
MAAKTWIGRILSGIAVLFMAADAITHILKIQPVIEAFHKLAIPETLSTPLGILVLVCLALYLYKRTRILGAVLLTGYLGGAVAIHLRAESTAFEAIFPVIIGSLFWVGLFLTDKRAQSMLAS